MHKNLGLISIYLLPRMEPAYKKVCSLCPKILEQYFPEIVIQKNPEKQIRELPNSLPM